MAMTRHLLKVSGTSKFHFTFDLLGDRERARAFEVLVFQARTVNAG
jgi:hypothetical protein